MSRRDHGYEKNVNIIKRELADILADARDPRLGFFTLMDVKVSPDLHYADVFISVINEDEEAETIEVLQEHRGHFRSELAKRLNTKHTPELRFDIDTLIKHTQRMDELFDGLEVEPPQPTDEEE